MKKLLSLLIVTCFILHKCVASIDVKSITYDSLIQSDYSDHVRSWEQFFAAEEIDSFLELGEGLSTKYFLDHCKHVTSIELLITSRSEFILPYYYDCQDAFSPYSNWTQQIHIFGYDVDKANELAINNINPELVATEYLDEIAQFRNEILDSKHFNVVFIDPGIHIRGDLINAFFNYVDIIVAHDTNFNAACYGWYKLATPHNYTVIHISHGCGTTFWIRREKKETIERFIKNLQKAKLLYSTQ